MGEGKRKGGLKIYLLLVTLAVPVVIFLFLKGFGENHYSVPVFYSQGIPMDTSECPKEDHAHIVDPAKYQFDFLAGSPTMKFNGKLSVVDIDREPFIPLGTAGNPLNRVVDHFEKENKVQFIFIRPDRPPVPEKEFRADESYYYVFGNMEAVSGFARCELVLLDFQGQIENNRRFVLVDKQGRIRGYYPVSDFDEVDRMILEMRIILKEEYR
jgi:protein SCO1/2